MEGYDSTQEGQRIDNTPKTGVATGNYFIDCLHGCWWEYVADDTHEKYWVIGEYPLIMDN